jgi:hypothetical protein
MNQNNWTQTALDDITIVRLTQPAVAQVLAKIILSGEKDRVDWKSINAAIVKRWSRSGRKRVLTMAWKVVEDAKRTALLEVRNEYHNL